MHRDVIVPRRQGDWFDANCWIDDRGATFRAARRVVIVMGDAQHAEGVVRPPTDGPDFVAFYRSEFLGATRLAFLLTGSQIAADDIAQDSFLAIESRFHELQHPRAYLRTTIVRRTIGLHRRDRRRAELLPKYYTPEWVDPPSREVIDVLATLPVRQRAALTLRYWAGLNNQEIADALRCRVGTVKSLISRGLERLRRDLDEEEP